jgi:zinc protease
MLNTRNHMKNAFFRSLILVWIVLFAVQPQFVLAANVQSDISSVNLKTSEQQVKETVSVSVPSEGVKPAVDADKTPDKLKEYVLANGLKVIFVKDKAFPFVSCFTWYKVGSRDDPQGMTGLSHLVEHLLFQNIGTFNGNQWANAVVRLGGEFSGFTSEDFTAFYSNLPTYQLELALRGEAARMRSAHFTKVDVAKEVEHLVKEEKAEEHDSMHMLNREVHALAYEKHPYHNPPGGWRHELEKLSFNEAKAYYDKYFYPNNATLVLVGNFDEQIARNLIEKHFGTIAKSESIPANVYPQERPQLAERQIRLKAQNGKESIILAYKVVGINDADAPVVSVVEQFINMQLHGALRGQLIDSGLCSSVQVAFEQKRDPGLLVIKCSDVAVNGSDKVVQILDFCLDQLRNKQLSDADVNRLVQQTEFNYYAEGDGPFRCAFQTGFFATLAKEEEAKLWVPKIKKITAADILRVAKTYLAEENRVLGHTAVVNMSSLNEEKRIDCFSTRKNISLANALADDHYRLAAYESGVIKPYAISSINAAVGQNASTLQPKPATKSESPKAEESALQYKLLRNGLRVIVLESHLNPLVQIYGAVKAGNIYEHSDQHGMSKLLAQLFDSGNMRYSRQQLYAMQADLGLPPKAMLKFVSTAENITFHVKCLSEDFGIQAKQLFSCLIDPRLQNTDFDLAKIDLATALRKAEKRAESRIDRTLLRSLITSNSVYFPMHPEEEISSISNFKLPDLVDFYHEHIIPGNTTIIVCGDVKADDVFSQLEQITQGWVLSSQTYASASKNVSASKLITSNRNAYKSSMILPFSHAAEIVFGKVIPIENAKQAQSYWAALSIADCALSSHPIFSHLAQQFNAKAELFDDSADDLWNTRIFKLDDKLLWSLNVHLPPRSSSATTVSAIQTILSQFSKCGLRQEEVAEAKKYLIGSIAVKECSDLEELTVYTFRGINELNEITPIIKMQKTINSLKYEEINEFITKIFKPDSAALVVAGPRELIKQVRPLQQSEASEINSD